MRNSQTLFYGRHRRNKGFLHQKKKWKYKSKRATDDLLALLVLTISTPYSVIPSTATQDNTSYKGFCFFVLFWPQEDYGYPISRWSHEYSGSCLVINFQVIIEVEIRFDTAAQE